MNRIFNIFVNKIVNILIIIILILTAFFIGLNTANAMEVTSWVNSYDDGPRDETPTMESITFNSLYTYENYFPDSVKNLVFNISNEKFFDNSLTLSDFYNSHSYVVRSLTESTIRVYVQDYPVMLDYQGLNPIEGSEIKFFFYNSAYFYRYSSYLYYGNNFGVYYNWYIDINYNSGSYTISDNNILVPQYETLCKKTGTDYISRTNTAPLFDSFNGNFSWIENWSIPAMPTPFQLSRESYPSIASIGPYYYYNIFDIPELQYVSSGVPGTDNPGNEESDSVTDAINKIFDWLNGDFAGYDEYNKFFGEFYVEDNGGISRIITSPLGLIRGLLNGNNLCSDLRIDFAFLGQEQIVRLPSGCILWDKVPTTALHLWHVLLVGIFGYRCLIDLFHTIENLKDPENSKVDTLDL